MESAGNVVKKPSDVTLEDIKQWAKEIGLKEFTKIGYIGKGVYQIGDCAFTGKEGWDAFKLELQRQAKINK